MNQRLGFFRNFLCFLLADALLRIGVCDRCKAFTLLARVGQHDMIMWPPCGAGLRAFDDDIAHVMSCHVMNSFLLSDSPGRKVTVGVPASDSGTCAHVWRAWEKVRYCIS